MPTLPHNVERSAFRRGEYVAYGHGVWNVRRVAGGWSAYHRHTGASVGGRTLAKVGELVERFAIRAHA